MSIRWYTLCFLLLGAVLASAQNQKNGAPKFTLPGNWERTADIVYATYGDRQLRLDLYMPKPKPAGLIPGIVVIRGGGWRQGDKNGFAPIAAGLAAKGLAAACIEYRVLPDVTIADAVQDTKAAVRWMRAEGKRYGIQADAIGAIGGSAGGHLVALLATSSNVSKLEGSGGHAGVSSRVQAVVPMAPVVDFMTMSQSRQESGGAAVRSIFGNDARNGQVALARDSPRSRFGGDAADAQQRGQDGADRAIAGDAGALQEGRRARGNGDH